MEVRGAAFLSGQTVLRLLLQHPSYLSGLAPYAACVGGDVRRRGRLDLGGVEAAKRANPGRRDLSGRLCGYGKHSDAHRDDHGRAAGLSAVGWIFPASCTWMEFVTHTAANLPALRPD